MDEREKLTHRVSGRRIRKPIGLRDWQLAQQRARVWEAEGIAAGGTPTVVKAACDKFVDDARARGLQESTLRKYRLLFRQLNDFGDQNGYIFLNQLIVDSAREFRGIWKLGPLASHKHLERPRSFFRFCVDSDWMETNPARRLKAPKIAKTPVVPFSESEIEKILAACDLYNGDGFRLKALTELMLLPGLRIGDACTIARDKFVQDDKGWKMELHTAKTGVKVYIPLPDDIVQTIQKLPGAHPF